ncbi:MAG TPA: phosphodiester glycosidase family protein [Allosphingosinicella sp.]|jgi:uncharacterized protein YigE (DUF2233 family)
MLHWISNAARTALLAGLLLAGGCRDKENEGGNAFDPASLQPAAACEPQSFEGSTFTVCTFDARKDELRLVLNGADGKPLRSLAALEESLGARAGEVRFAMNGGMYDEDGLPIGLFVQGGKTVKTLNRNSGPGNFHLLPNGVFAVDRQGRASVAVTEKFKARDIVWATQSGPMLLIDGQLHPKFDEDGPSRLIRNGVGVTDTAAAFFVISEEGVSFGRFARFFRDALGCRNALYLDGTVSSLWHPAEGRQDPYSGLGPLIAIFRKG